MIIMKGLLKKLSHNSIIQDLNMVRIYFTNRQDAEDGFYLLLSSGLPIRALGKGKYLINAAQRTLLDIDNIRYQLDLDLD